MKIYTFLLLLSSTSLDACQKALSINNQELQEEPQESIQELDAELTNQIEKNLKLANQIAQLPLSSDDEEEFCALLQKQTQISNRMSQQLADILREIQEFKRNAGRDQAAHCDNDMSTSFER